MPAAVVLAGMGGSAVGGELLRGIIAGECPVPVTRVRGFGVPSFVGPGTLVVCVSYSGDTAETLACARQAHDRGASVLAVGAGGTLGTLAGEWGAPFAQVPGWAVSAGGARLPVRGDRRGLGRRGARARRAGGGRRSGRRAGR